MMGSSSLLETGFSRATFVVPAGAKNGGRGLPKGFSRLGTRVSCGVPTNIGLGFLISIGTISTGRALSVTIVSVSADGLPELSSADGLPELSSADGLPELSSADSGEDFLQAGTKHKNIANNTSTQTFAIEPKSFFIISFDLKNSRFCTNEKTINYQ
jgi:hypothetical protein